MFSFNSVTLIWKLTYRNWMFWVSFIAGIIHLWLLFHQYIFDDYTFNVGNALVMSSFIVQGGILVFMFYGIYLQNLEREVKLQHHIRTIGVPYLRSVTVGKFIFIFLFVISLCVIAFSLFSFLLIKRGFPIDSFVINSFIYIALYWGLTFVISFGIGMILALWFQNKSVYLVSIFLSVVMGPLNSTFGNWVFLEFLNLGQIDYSHSYHSLYGYSLEMYHVLKKTIIFSSLFILYGISKTIIDKKNTWRNVGFILLGFVKLSFLLIWFYETPEQTRFSFDGNSEAYQEFVYYNKMDSSIEQQNIEIEKYRIDLDLSRELSVDLEMDVKNYEKSPLEIINLSIYHRLKVSTVKSGDKSLLFSQESDFLKVYLEEPIPSNQTVTLQIKYSGSSSPFYMVNSQAVYLPANFSWLPTTTIGPAFVIESNLLHRSSLQPMNSVKYELNVKDRNEVYTNIEKVENGKYSGENNGLTIVSGQLTEKKIGNKQVIIPSTWSLSLDGFSDLQEDIDDMLTSLSLLSGEKLYLPDTVMILPTTDIYDFLMQENYWLFDDHIILGYDRNTPMPENAFELEFHQQHMVHSLVSSATWKKENLINENLEIPILFDAFYANWYQKSKGLNIEDSHFENLLDSYLSPYEDAIIDTYKKETISEIVSIMNNHSIEDQHNFLYRWYHSQIRNSRTDWDSLSELVLTFNERGIEDD